MACGEIAVCVLRADQSFFSRTAAPSTQTIKGIRRSTSIVPLLQGVLLQAELDWHQLDALALGGGPGSFTGLRIAAATLAGINSGLHVPVIHLSSLAITARQANTDAPVWVLEDAKAGEAFVGRYQPQAMQADACLSWSAIAALEPDQFCCHAEPPLDMQHWTRVPLTLSRSAALALETRAACAANIDVMDYPSPVYLQVSQAERHARA